MAAEGRRRFVKGFGFAEGTQKVHAKNERENRSFRSDGSYFCTGTFSTLLVYYERSTEGCGLRDGNMSIHSQTHDVDRVV